MSLLFCTSYVSSALSQHSIDDLPLILNLDCRDIVLIVTTKFSEFVSSLFVVTMSS